MILKPQGVQKGSPPVSPATSTPPVSPFAGKPVPVSFMSYHIFLYFILIMMSNIPVPSCKFIV